VVQKPGLHHLGPWVVWPNAREKAGLPRRAPSGRKKNRRAEIVAFVALSATISRNTINIDFCRERRRDGLRCLTIELRETEIDALARNGFLKTDTRNDLRLIEMALYEFLERTLG
jgi:hypothetical protein